MINSYKISFSMPREDFIELEKARGKMGMGRSAIIDKAIRFWLDWLKQRELIKQYIKGYTKIPEDMHNLKALEKAQIETLDTKEEW